VFQDNHCELPDVLEFLGLNVPSSGATLDESSQEPGKDAEHPDEVSEAALIASARLKRIQVCSQAMKWPEDTPILRNLRSLQAQLKLSEVDFRVLLLCVLSQHVLVLGQTLEALGSMSDLKLFSALGIVLETSAESIQTALAASSPLSKSGIAQLQSGDIWHPNQKIELCDGLAERMSLEFGSPLDIFADNFVPSLAPRHGFDEFEHFKPEAEWLAQDIRRCVQRREVGANVWVFGDPGAGKTEFVRALCRHIGVDAFEVAVKRADGQRVGGKTRLQAYARSQQVLQDHENAVIVFDEAEDLLGSPGIDDDEHPFLRRSSPGKGFFNHLLETNTVPAIFISNKVRDFDPAHLRRFRWLLEARVPQRVREQILRAKLLPLGVSEAWCARYAASERMVPALADNLARVLGSVIDDKSERPAPDEVASRLAEQTLRVQGARFLLPEPKSSSPFYSLSMINASVDIESLIDGLKRSQQGKLVFTGPSGAGKSALAEHIALRIGRGLLIVRPSDLLGSYVGETERAIAAAFEVARRDRKVLVIDEADSFFGARTQADRNWQVTMVNESLQQVEAFDGIFIATTNLLDFMDPASLRRFDAKVEFRYMTGAQAQQAMARLCQDLGVYETGCEHLVGKLSQLTPGDFATVRRQVRFRPVGSAADVARRLYDEVRHKPGSRRAMGFVSPDV
jgi:tRNA A37 threonylcarbamoyladenosine biosynthesis protein TsaE